jgi:dipeptidyl aminopeptidase/acylaminoacyl peptidase
MKRCIKLLLFVLVFHLNVLAQPVTGKPALDSTVIKNWPRMNEDAVINSDGSYFFYTIGNVPRESLTLVVQKTDNSWKEEFPNVTAGLRAASFVANKQILFRRNDSLFLFSLTSKSLKPLAAINGYKEPKSGNGEWLAYQLRNNRNNLILVNLSTGKQQQFADVTAYSFDEKGSVLLIKTKSTDKNGTKNALQWIDLNSDKQYHVWTASAGEKLGGYALDQHSRQITFTVSREDGSNSIWYYTPSLDKPVQMVANGFAGIDKGLLVSNAAPKFSQNGNYIFFSLRSAVKDNRKASPGAVQVDVWSYRDSVLQSTQLLTLNNPEPEYAAVVNIVSKKIVRLCVDDEWIAAVNGEYVVVGNTQSIPERWWNKISPKLCFLVTLKDGTRHRLNVNADGSLFNFSPEEKYLVYFDTMSNAYYSYNLASGETINVSKLIPFSLVFSNRSDIEDKDSLQLTMPAIGIAGWLPNDDALLVYDRYDIWQIDPTSRKEPVNITNGYGRRNDITLIILNEKKPTYLGTLPIFSAKEKLLLSAFNTKTKYNGFYQKRLDKKGDPELLSMGPYHIYSDARQTPRGIDFNYYPSKSQQEDTWLVMRKTASDAPNYFLTSDFRKFNQLTNLQPQKDYNWLTSELIDFEQLDGTVSQGILYKPENFDSTKKYPIIFYYYDKLSQYRYQYWEPDFCAGAINIPWFVSHGYLVFTPDIHYIITKIGESVCNSVLGAAKQLSQERWVDAKAMGINGHSFGGYETNYLVTHSNLFTAAITADGVSDFVSLYNGLGAEFFACPARHDELETGNYFLYYTLWQRPDIYIKNSPIFCLGQVSAPLLIIHHKKDYLVPWEQSVELFNGLRRLQKKAWMLQYDKGGHGVQGREAEDLTIRMTQFFDHYLKGAPPPRWLTEGIPAKLKGVDLKLDLDLSGKEE